MKISNLAAVFSLSVLGFAVPGHVMAEPVDYVRVCDAYGSGFFYIPGTETCLRISGYVDYQYSQLQNTHSLGGGTVVRGAGGPANETFGGMFGNWIQRNGVRFGIRTSGDYGGAAIGPFPLVGAYLEYEGAKGDEGYRGNPAIGTDGITRTGFTFLEPHPMYGTGVIATTNGFGLDSSGQLDNAWHRANLGLKFSLPGFEDDYDDRDNYDESGRRKADDDEAIRIRGRIGLFYDYLKTDASGTSNLTFNGAPFAGYYQNYDLSARDQYFGVRVGTHISLPPCMDGRWKTSFGADLYLGYHNGDGSYSQQTGAGVGQQVNQMRTYSNDGFTVGAGVSASTSYEFAPGWRLGSKLEWSYLPKVTSFSAPQNPSEQATAGFSSKSATRVIASFGIRRNF